MSNSLGFHNLPFLAHRKSVKKGFEFTIMVVGESGLGKSTLVRSLFLTNLFGNKTCPPAAERIKPTPSIDATTVDIEEKGVKLRLTVVDTPGFGDAVDNRECWQPIIDFINEKYDQYFKDESGINRRNIEDHRVHCCLYFISPSGHGLKPLDIAFMKELHNLVNIIPVIAKSDTLTQTEVRTLKTRILQEISDNGIRIYNGEIDEEDDSPEIRELRDAIPMAVVGSTTLLEVGNKRVRGRLYPWGVVEIENKEHCDYILLRNMLIRTHMQDLKDYTQDVHYENFRKKKLLQGSPLASGPGGAMDFAGVVASVAGGNVQDEILKAKERELEMMRLEMARLQAQLRTGNDVV
ncbi:PREDICTED: septin-1-like [Amphimedon queenslandica]|uniref:Septin-type G domain-containing protein n=1 Tax=Amphimedon queenslandica TaxID=400682 RepID=A0A1X7U6V8_AMPQE|nr:PREDICTED: septin-1-like [Amphimedon queenslandica]|eukprot:XP_003388905.1 PREDICTED: septin-1-like [Amphimedon queenslandica]